MSSFKSIARTTAIVSGAVVLSYVAFATSWANSVGVYDPGSALKLWPFSTRAQVALAQNNLTKTDQRAVESAQAAQLSSAALLREPANAVAARTSGAAKAMMGKTVEGERYMRYAETMSRRDLPTQLWLIESSVGRNDVRAALIHYDRALRVSVPSREMLFPVLLGASADPALTGDIAGLIARRPNWWASYFELLTQRSKDAKSLYVITNALNLSAGIATERALLSGAMRQLVDLNTPEMAWRLYIRGIGSAKPPLVRNAAFEADPSLVPFDWLIRQSEEGKVARAEREDGASVLSFDGASAADGAVQIVRLEQGPYRLSARFGAIPREAVARPRLSAACINEDGAVLAQILPQPHARPRRVAATFTVPHACEFVRLSISAGTSMDDMAEAPWIGSVELKRTQ